MTRTDELINKKITGEASCEELKELVDYLILEVEKPKMEKDLNSILFKCKPVYNFQSVEFEFEVGGAEDIKKMMDLYKTVLTELVFIAPEQEKRVVEPLATEKQKQIMKINNIKFDNTTTMSQAQALIKKSIEDSSK